MAAGIDIRPATLRDMSFVTAWLNPDDEREVRCQIGPDTSMHDVGHSMLMAGDCYCAFWRGKPIAAFGMAAINAAVASVWFLGTRDNWRAAAATSRFLLNDMVPRWAEAGFVAMEARSIADHKQAHSWMLSTGAEIVGPPHVYGRGGENFLLFRWTIDGLPTYKEKIPKGAT